MDGDASGGMGTEFEGCTGTHVLGSRYNPFGLLSGLTLFECTSLMCYTRRTHPSDILDQYTPGSCPCLLTTSYLSIVAGIAQILTKESQCALPGVRDAGLRNSNAHQRPSRAARCDVGYLFRLLQRCTEITLAVSLAKAHVLMARAVFELNAHERAEADGPALVLAVSLPSSCVH